MISLAKGYRPVLSTPFGREGYREYPPCAALGGLIRCFWEDDRVTEREILVIPDTCMDIIFELSEGGRASFCGLDEGSFYAGNARSAYFGIRFYAWAAKLFSRRDLSGSVGRSFELGEYFDGHEELLFAVRSAETFEERAAAAEKWLLERLGSVVIDSDLFNAMDLIVTKNGNVDISELCMHTAVSARTLERLFARGLGVSPKKLSSLIRYQLLWQDMLKGSFDVSDAVEKFGYYDQAHLLNDFRRRHLMNPRSALEYAKKRG